MIFLKPHLNDIFTRTVERVKFFDGQDRIAWHVKLDSDPSDYYDRIREGYYESNKEASREMYEDAYYAQHLIIALAARVENLESLCVEQHERIDELEGQIAAQAERDEKDKHNESQ